MWCLHTENVRMMRCGVRTRKMCVCARPVSWFCANPPVAFGELRLTGRETQQKKKKGWRSGLLVLVDNKF